MRYILLFSLICSLLVSCQQNDNSEELHNMSALTNKDIPGKIWESLSDKKIFFGHQSVGFNIIDGIKDLMAYATPEYNLNIIELSAPEPLSAPGFYHARVGSNVDPISKIDDFARQMDAGIGNTADIAFFKFCFVDIRSQTDIKKVFQHYTQTMERLKEKYPQTKFIHFTVPLSTTVTSWKTKVKTLIGKKDIWEYDDNIRKNQFNNMIRGYYSGKEPVFDIAKFESLYPSGRRSFFKVNGQEYFDLAPEYTYDDGHLNERGRKWVAEHLLIFLSGLN